MPRFTFLFESLGVDSLRSEAVVQMLLFASTHTSGQRVVGYATQEISLVAIDGDISGREAISLFFPMLSSASVSFAPLPTPRIQSVGFPEHQQVYAVFEALKNDAHDEIHFPDAKGFGHYLVLAKKCGVHFCNTTLVAHILGGTLFCREAEEAYVDSETMLMVDTFECSSVEHADCILVHDRKAWSWYRKKVRPLPETVIDIAWTSAIQPGAPSAKVGGRAIEETGKPARIVYLGALGPEGGLRNFCDAVSCFLVDADCPVEVVFIGEPKPVGAIDAITYIRVRTQAWQIPVTIERNLNILEELDYVARKDSIVFCNAMRKEGLRSRLFDSLGIPFVLVSDNPDRTGAVATETPARIRARMLEVRNRPRAAGARPDIVTAWSSGRTWSIPSVRAAPLLRIESDPPLVSVIVTHFSRPEKLRFALRSLKAQSYGNFEVIVVDDGSPDPSVANELRSIKREIAPLGWRLVRQENKYLGAARNCGAALAKGKYLLFMDDDNCARSTEIETLAAVAERLNADIVTPFYDGFEAEDDVEQDRPAVRFAPIGADLALAVFTPCFGDANGLYSSKLFKELGGFSEDYGITHEDWEFHVSASLAGAKSITLPTPLFWYRIDPAGMYRSRQMQLHSSANQRRHIRPYLDTLPHFQGKLVQIAQGLSTLNRNSTQPSVSRPAAEIRRSRVSNAPFARVAIIVRTKDRPVMLQRAIRDILAQSYKDWLMVVVNDGGNTETLDLVLNEFSDALGERLLTVSHPVSLGMQTASNMGISVCDSDFVVIHDDDDTWHQEFLSRTVAEMDAHGWNPTVAGVVTWTQVIVEEILDGYEIVETDRFMFNDKLHTLSLVELGIENRFPPISFLFRRTAFEQVGRFREEFGVLGDWDFHLRILAKFDIHVITEPLAGYHHRADVTTGAYGNSVHAQKDVHAAKRIDLVNSFLRSGGSGKGDSNLDQVLLQGQFYKHFEREQRDSFKKLHNYLWEIEQQVKYVATRTRTKRKLELPGWKGARRKTGNLVENGDFRRWPGVGTVFAGKKTSYGIICPGFLVFFDGKEATYQVEKRTSEGEPGLPEGMTYLRIVNKGHTGAHKWFHLECPSPDVEAMAGRTICVSGLGRLRGLYEWISIGGRFDLPDRSKMHFPEEKVFLSGEFQPWSCTLHCPSPGSIDFSVSLARVYLKLHYNQPFQFDVTNIQVEISDKSTSFKYYAGARQRPSSEPGTMQIPGKFIGNLLRGTSQENGGSRSLLDGQDDPP